MNDRVERSGSASEDRAARDRVQIHALRERLASANLRIAQLERVERDLQRRNAFMRTEILSTLESAALNCSGDDMFPAYRMEQVLRALTIVQRRDLWLRMLVQEKIEGPLIGLTPHDGGDDPLTLLVHGSGGYGDLLHLSAVVRALDARFPCARIVVVHTHPGTQEVFATNPYLFASLQLDGERLRHFLDHAAALDIFDLVADVRYVVTYAVPPRSRVSPEFLRLAHRRASDWQSYVRRDWPHLNNRLGAAAGEAGLNLFGLSGHTGNLDLSNASHGDFFPTRNLDAALASSLSGRAFVTLHHGADRYMIGANGRQTKNLPIEAWRTIAETCGKAGLTTVQLGEAHEEAIPGIGLDLRGRCSLEETALVLKHAQVHLDTEGGLVHLARAMGTRCVVAFGPTPVAFFGYEPHANLAPGTCGDCWWTQSDWAQACVKGDDEPACMLSHDAAVIARTAMKLASPHKMLRIRDDASLATTDAATWSEQQGSAETAWLRDDGTGEPVAIPRRGQPDALSIVPVVTFRACVDRRDVLPCTGQHIPLNTNALKHIRLDLRGCQGADVAVYLREAARIVALQGCILLQCDHEWIEAFEAAPGARVVLDMVGLGGKRLGERQFIVFDVVESSDTAREAPPSRRRLARLLKQ